MRALIQRVMNAKVTVNDEVVSNIGQGICVFIGISTTDVEKDMEYIVRKILSIKFFDDNDNKRWKNNVVNKNFEVLCVSQFTLYNTWQGNKPDFHKSMPAAQSKEFYEKFLQMLKKAYHPDKIKDGSFGEYMQVYIQNDGPVTFTIESPAPNNKTLKNQPTATIKTDSEGKDEDNR